MKPLIIALTSIGLTVCAVLVVATLFVYFIVLEAPSDFPEETYLEIPQGSTLSSVSDALAESNIINSSFFFKVGAYVKGTQDQIKSGNYYFDEPARTDVVLSRIINGYYNIPAERVTIVEGQASYQYVPVIAAGLPFVQESELLKLITSQKKEGYLYPDTYFFPENSTPEQVIQIMEENFKKKIAPLALEIQNSSYTQDEIITMASLIENEAGNASYETKRKVAGVLWNRVQIGMPIQADAVFPFILKKYLPRVLFSHLEINSPYNIYKNVGLPPGPIGSPSIESIRAAVNPAETDNLFYLTGFDGNFYYSKTNEGHEQNRRKYLNYN